MSTGMEKKEIEQSPDIFWSREPIMGPRGTKENPAIVRRRTRRAALASKPSRYVQRTVPCRCCVLASSKTRRENIGNRQCCSASPVGAAATFLLVRGVCSGVACVRASGAGAA